MRGSTRSRCTRACPRSHRRGRIAECGRNRARRNRFGEIPSRRDRPGGPGRARWSRGRVTSRVPYGPIVPTYGGGGGAVDLERAGAIISAGFAHRRPGLRWPCCSVPATTPRRSPSSSGPATRRSAEPLCRFPLSLSPIRGCRGSARRSSVPSAANVTARPGPVALVSKRTVTTPCPAPCTQP